MLCEQLPHDPAAVSSPAAMRWCCPEPPVVIDRFHICALQNGSHWPGVPTGLLKEGLFNLIPLLFHFFFFFGIFAQAEHKLKFMVLLSPPGAGVTAACQQAHLYVLLDQDL